MDTNTIYPPLILIAALTIVFVLWIVDGRKHQSDQQQHLLELAIKNNQIADRDWRIGQLEKELDQCRRSVAHYESDKRRRYRESPNGHLAEEVTMALNPLKLQMQQLAAEIDRLQRKVGDTGKLDKNS